MDMIVSAQGNIITKQEVFHAFQRYCDEMSLGKLSEQTVTRRLKQHVTGLTDRKARVDSYLLPSKGKSEAVEYGHVHLGIKF